MLYVKGHIPMVRPLRVGNPDDGPILTPLDAHIPVIQAAHHSPGTFHLGVNRTEMVLREFAYFPNMVQVISEYLKKCDQCQRGKRLPSKLSPGLGKTSSLEKKPLQCWSIDVIFMPKGLNQLKFILTMVDISTQWIEAFPMRSNNAKTVASLISEQMIPRYGEGLTFISDQGKEQTANVVIDAIQRAGGQHYATTAHHSKSNPVERANLTMGQILRAKLIDSGWPKEKWPLCLAEALYTMRMSPDTQTGDSPFFRVHGRKPYTRVNTLFGTSPEDHFGNISPWHPSKEEALLCQEEENSILEEDEDQVCIRRKAGGLNPKVCNYQKVKSEDGKMTHFTDVATLVVDTARKEHLVNLYRDKEELGKTIRAHNKEQALARRNQAAAQKHEANARQYEKRQPIEYSPIEGELVDWKAPIDPDSTNHRKLKQTWLGPYRTVWKPDHDFTCGIQKVNPQSLNIMAKRIIRVAVEDLRPSTIYHLFRRPRGAEWVPQWMNPKEVDGEIELEVDPDECHSTDDEDEIEDAEVRRLYRLRSLRKRTKENKDEHGQSKSAK